MTEEKKSVEEKEVKKVASEKPKAEASFAPLSDVRNPVSVEKKQKQEEVKEQISNTTKASKKGKQKRQVLRGQATIRCTYNNTMVMLADAQGGALAWSSSGLLGFKGAKKSTPYAATQVVADVTEKVRKYQLKELTVQVNGVGSGREAAIRALANNGFEILSIKDSTPIAHNGCRPRRPRRV
jgi:small subunit ribosomal protein S11